jgi:hypothetical protein
MTVRPVECHQHKAVMLCNMGVRTWHYSYNSAKNNEDQQTSRAGYFLSGKRILVKQMPNQLFH